MKKLALNLLCLFFSLQVFSSTPPPNEGLWLPIFFDDYTYTQMKLMGLRLSPEQLYSDSMPSLKDAVVLFGNHNGSASVISEDGLLLTNHHCAFPYIVEHSTEEHNYIKNGFWAKNRKEELPNPNLKVSFLVKMENVTASVLKNIPDNTSELIRYQWLENNKNLLISKYSEQGKYRVEIQSMFNGIEYFLFVYQDFYDVRLVGTPPTSLGKYGGETDNWMWPRHCADFCLFRIYTAPDGSPAPYDSSNVPLKAKYAIPISMQGIILGDFTMTLGYPISTDRYISSYEIDNLIHIINPAYQVPFDAMLPSMQNAINQKDKTKIGYGSVFNGFANAWKRIKGENNSLVSMKVVDKKREQESLIIKWIMSDSLRLQKYGNPFSELDSICKKLNPDLVNCFWYGNISILLSKTLMLPYHFSDVKPVRGKWKYSDEQKTELLNRYKEYSDNLNADLEVQMISASFGLWKKLPEKLRPDYAAYFQKNYESKEADFAKAIVNNSIFSSEEKFKKFLKNPKIIDYQEDPLIRYFYSIIQTIKLGEDSLQLYYKQLKNPQKMLLAAMKELSNEYNVVLYPEADGTLRYTYGKISNYNPFDAVSYNYQTTHQGMLEKYKSNDPEFGFPDRLKELFEQKDFANYDLDGFLPICFITDNDFTRGSSGSPVINKNGELVGCAFDGNWEALANQVVYNTKLQRTICVDIRYILFIIDKYAGAGYLLDEMSIIH